MEGHLPEADPRMVAELIRGAVLVVHSTQEHRRGATSGTAEGVQLISELARRGLRPHDAVIQVDEDSSSAMASSCVLASSSEKTTRATGSRPRPARARGPS